jgi:glutathione S-transferase
MVLKLYTRPEVGGGSAIVALTLVEKHVPYEHVPINMDVKEHKTPEYMAKHPFGQVPMIVSDAASKYTTTQFIQHSVAGRSRRSLRFFSG